MFVSWIILIDAVEIRQLREPGPAAETDFCTLL